ncbi:MAG TPA: hypothetical protein VLS51_03290 [Propionibacteriaceae bacterium]|nr:hypothetical protein [Propionibacteriaceae bacterium]
MPSSSPPPSPTATHCVTQPSRCGYPDATTTGAQDRTALRRVPQDLTSGTGWRWDARGWLQVTDDNAVVENVEVSGSIDVKGAGATIRNVVILVSGDTWGIALRHTTNVTITRTTIGSAGLTPRLMVGIKDIYGDAVGTTVTANDIAGTSTGVQIGTGLIRDNYIHDLGMVDGDHVNGITSNGSDRRLVIEHNTVLNRFSQTDAIGLFQDFGVEADRLISDNLVAGGGWTVYAGDNKRFGPTHDITVVGNRFSKIYFPNGGSYGPGASFDVQGVGNSWSGNFWDEDLSPVA